MKLKKWALIAEIVGGAAIVISLIVLIVEIRGNTDAIQAQAEAARLESDRARRYPLIANEGGLAKLILKKNNGEELSDLERFQVARYYSDIFDTFHWQFREAQAGRLPKDQLPVGKWRRFWNQPGLVEQFEREKAIMDPDWAEFWEDNVINARE